MISAQRGWTVAAALCWNYLALHGTLSLFGPADPLRTLELYAVIFAIAASAWGVHRYWQRGRSGS